MAILAFSGLSAALVDTFRNLHSSQVVQSGASHLSQERPPFGLWEKDARAFLANFLENPNHALEVAHMESRQDQSYMTEVTVAFLEIESTGFAHRSFVGDTHARIERTMRNHRAVMFKVEKLSVRNFHHSLADNIVIRPGGAR